MFTSHCHSCGTKNGKMGCGKFKGRQKLEMFDLFPLSLLGYQACHMGCRKFKGGQKLE